jgi:ribosomal protein S18 acetylase RimI-like enzyme
MTRSEVRVPHRPPILNFMNLSIAKATLEDAAAIAAIMTQATQFKLDHDDEAWGHGEYTIKEVSDPISKGFSYVVRLDDEAVAAFHLVWQDGMMWGPQEPVAGYMHQLGLKNGWHGQGIGRQVIDWAAKEVARNNRQFLRLDCPPGNTSLRQYYEGLGFIHQGNRDIQRSDGSIYAASLYQRKV